MSFELRPGDYALMHANGMSWSDVLKRHRVHVQADTLKEQAAMRRASKEAEWEAGDE